MISNFVRFELARLKDGPNKDVKYFVKIILSLLSLGKIDLYSGSIALEMENQVL